MVRECRNYSCRKSESLCQIHFLDLTGIKQQLFELRSSSDKKLFQVNKDWMKNVLFVVQFSGRTWMVTGIAGSIVE